jgi:hypothetical protein
MFAMFMPLLTFGMPLLASAGAVLVDTSVYSETSASLAPVFPPPLPS